MDSKNNACRNKAAGGGPIQITVKICVSAVCGGGGCVHREIERERERRTYFATNS